MNDKKELTKKFIMVDMNDAMISTNDRYIIGTDALATCTGVLIYSENTKRAIVAHISSDYMKAIDKIFNLIIKNKLYNEKLKYAIIRGTDIEAHDYYGIINILLEHFKDYIPFNDNIVLNGVGLDEKTFSNQFAFDALNGEFVTNKVLFGIDYYIVNPITNSNTSNRSR